MAFLTLTHVKHMDTSGDTFDGYAPVIHTMTKYVVCVTQLSF
jgi:hypothetical protein